MPQQLVYAHDILDDKKQEERENNERECNKNFVTTLKMMNSMVREKLEDMFEIVRKHEKTNKDIKKDLEVLLQALQSHYADKEAYTKYRDTAAHKKKFEETIETQKSLFMAEKERYFKRHSIRMREFKDLLAHCQEFLDQPRLLYGGRQKVLDLREIQKFKTGNALAQIEQWESTYNAESFQQSKIVDSTLVSNDEYKNVMRKKV